MNSYIIPGNRKIIRFKKDKIYFECDRKYRDNIVFINNVLAIQLGFCTENKVPKRKKFRKFIVEQLKKQNLKISGKDIKRMENPNYREIPFYIIEILKKIVDLIIEQENFTYRAPDNDNRIVSVFLLEKNIEYINNFFAYTNGLSRVDDLNAQISALMINEIHYKLEMFNEEHNNIFNQLFM